MFRMDDIRRIAPNGKIAGMELYIEAEVHDWFYVQTAKGFAICVVYSSDVDLKLLGDSSRTFKPNKTFAVYVRIAKFAFCLP